jgi:transketolase
VSFARNMANAIRFLSVDAVESAKSGHPGMPLGMADIAFTLWKKFLKHNPNNPSWRNRDRFVLSNGHGSMLLYSLLHLTGYDLSINDLKQFRKIGSKTPGHPEIGVTPGVEATTGPLGQGIANAVGIAIAEKVMSSTYNKDNFKVIDHYTYVFAGDGCLMEGVSHEACSLAGTLKLGKLIVFWDDNGISIDGRVDSWFNENVAERFKAYGFQVITDVDGHNYEDIASAITAGQQNHTQPTLICCKTKIGFGSPTYQDTAKVHGAPLGREEVLNLRKNLNWENGPFDIPDYLKEEWDHREIGDTQEKEWVKIFNNYKTKYPELATQLESRYNNSNFSHFSSSVLDLMLNLQAEGNSIATRAASKNCIEFFQDHIPGIFGGSADLSCSNLTEGNNSKAIKNGWKDSNYLHFGVREFAMFAISNGLSSYGCFIPFCGTFLTFVDYGKNALRLAAMAKQRVIYVLTHDSIALGEDGPTHQPVEHNSMLRAIPGVRVWRPSDSVETAAAWYDAINYATGPSCLLLSRQSLKVQERDKKQVAAISCGGYTLKDFGGNPNILIIATGSEVTCAIDAANILFSKGIEVRVVSMPCLEVFEQQELEYKDSVLNPNIKTRVAVEAGSTQCWYRIIGANGFVYGLDRFGESGTGEDVMMELGFAGNKLALAIERFCEKNIDYISDKGEDYVD